MPSVRGGAPALLATLFLRLPLLVLAWVVAFNSGNQLLRGLFVFVCAVALLPPFQFFSTLDDINYRQQFILAIITLVGGGVGLSGQLHRWEPFIAAATAVVGAVLVLLGTVQGYSLMHDYGLPTQIGLGSPIFAVCCLGLALFSLKQTRQSIP